MHPTITQKALEIAEICRRYGVRCLDLFGSAARGRDFDPDCSDADFLVEFEDDNGKIFSGNHLKRRHRTRMTRTRGLDPDDAPTV